MVMYLGKIVEYGPRDQIFNNPQHPYTLALLKSSPNVFEENDQHEPLKGEPPSPINPPSGCSFHERCPQATERCQRETPLLSDHKERAVACFNL
jgi:dipeptide transport system ATP-binding protein